MIRELVISGKPSDALVAAHEHGVELLGTYNSSVVPGTHMHETVAHTTATLTRITSWIAKTMDPTIPGALLSYREWWS